MTDVQATVGQQGTIRVTYCECPTCGQQHYKRKQRRLDRESDMPPPPEAEGVLA